MQLALPYILLSFAPAVAQDAAAPEGEGAAITVRGERERAPDPQETSASVTVLEVDERLPSSTDVADLVESASGTTVQRLGGLGAWSGVSIRGSNLRHTEVYLDGVPLNPDGASSVNLSELPLRAFERVEIYRGNAPPEFASAPMGGVVNLVTGESDDRSTTAAGTYGSHRTGRLTATASLPGTLREAPTDTFLVVETFTTEGDYEYFDDSGTEYNLLDDRIRERENNDKRQLSAHARWRVGDDRLRLSLMDAFLARDEGLPGHSNNPTSEARLSTTRNLAVAQADGGAGAVRVRGRLWGFVRAEELDDRAGEVGTGSQLLRSRTDSVGALLHARWAPSPLLTPALTGAARRDSYSELELLSGAESAPRVRASLTGTASATALLLGERLSFTPLLQLTWLDNRALGELEFDELPSAEPTYLHLSPRIGAWAGPTDWLALKANFGRYLRPPDFAELYGDRGAQVGNPDLAPEQGTQWDVGARLTTAGDRPLRGAVDVSHFWNHTRDLIVWVQNGQRVLVPLNLEDAWIQGLEVALTLDGWGLIETQTNLTRNVSVNLSTDPNYANNQLPRIPTWEIYHRTGLYRGEWIRLGHTFSYTDGNYWDRTNWYLATPRPIHGAFLRVQPGPRAPSLEVEARNLIDRIAEVVPRNPLDPEDDAMVVQSITDFVGYPLPGRTVLVTLRWEAGP